MMLPNLLKLFWQTCDRMFFKDIRQKFSVAKRDFFYISYLISFLSINRLSLTLSAILFLFHLSLSVFLLSPSDSSISVSFFYSLFVYFISHLILSFFQCSIFLLCLLLFLSFSGYFFLFHLPSSITIDPFFSTSSSFLSYHLSLLF